MKRLLLALIVAVALGVATVSPALAIDLVLPNGETVFDLPDDAANAGHSGKVGICPAGGGL